MGENNLDFLIGQRVVSAKTIANNPYEPDRINEIYITCESGDTYRLYHNQNYGEKVYLVEGADDLWKLLGEKIISARKSTNAEKINGNYYKELWTYYKLTTDQGYIDLKWCGESDSHYSLEVSIEQTRYRYCIENLVGKTLNFVSIRPKYKDVELVLSDRCVKINSYQDNLHLVVRNKKGIYVKEQGIEEYCGDKIVKSELQKELDADNVSHNYYNIETERGGFTLDFFADLTNPYTEEITYLIDRPYPNEYDY